MRDWLKRVLPVRWLAGIGDLRSLPADARLSWLRSAIGRARRDAAAVARAGSLSPKPRVVMVCHGNIYRSPFAAAVLEALHKRRPDVPMEIASAGLLGGAAREAPADARRLAAELGYSLETHRSSVLTEELAASADLLVVMDRRNEALVRARFSAHAPKILMLGALDPMARPGDVVIPDPYAQGDDVLRAVYTQIVRCVVRLHSLLGQGTDGIARPTAFKKLARKAAMTPALAPLWLRWAAGDAAILMLHRFEDRERGTPGHSPDQLAAHLEYLRAHRYHLTPLQDLMDRLLCGEPPVPRSVAFTVDDGFDDFATIGAPLFAAYDCPATLFLVTGFVDGECWLWYSAVEYLVGDAPVGELRFAVGNREEHLLWRSPTERHRQTWALIERLKRVPDAILRTAVTALAAAQRTTLPRTPPARFAPIDVNAIRSWGRRGMTFGAHSRTHPILSNTTDEQSQREIADSWARVQALSEHTTTVFAYPNGMVEDFGEREQRGVLAAGLTAAVASVGGHCSLAHVRANRFSVPRIPYSDDVGDVRQSLAGIQRVKRRLRGAAW